MSTRGSRVQVRLQNDEEIDGWLYAESRLGLYLALDKEAKEIRFIPEGTWQSIGYEYSDMAEFSSTVPDLSETNERAFEVSESFKREVGLALDKVDYNRIRRINSEFETLQDYFAGSYDRMSFQRHTRNENQHSLLEISLRLRATYSALVDETERSSLKNVLFEYSTQIQNLISLGGLPMFDYHMAESMSRGDEKRFVLESMVHLARSSKLLIETHLGKDLLREISVNQIAESEIVANEKDSADEKELKEEDTSKWPTKLKRTAALGKIAVGGGLAAANIAAGVFAGVVSALPTLGIGTVAGAVGVATSAYTGLNAACDGLKDFATALESK